MPKIRDLGFNHIPFAAADNAGGYRMCGQSTIINPSSPGSTPDCGQSTIVNPPSKPDCGQSTIINPPSKPDCGQSTIINPPGQKNAGGLPHHAVVQLRQQLQQQIGG